MASRWTHREEQPYSYSHDTSRRVEQQLKGKPDAFPSRNPSKTPLPPPQQHIYAGCRQRPYIPSYHTITAIRHTAALSPLAQLNGFRSVVECCFGFSYSVSFYLKRLGFVFNTFLTLFLLGMSLSTPSSFSLNGTWEEIRRGRSNSHKTSDQGMPQFSLPPPIQMRNITYNCTRRLPALWTSYRCLSSANHKQTQDRFILTGTKFTTDSHSTTIPT